MKPKTTKNRNKAHLFLKKFHMTFMCQILILLFTISFTTSCSKDSEISEKEIEENNPNSALELIDISIQLP